MKRAQTAHLRQGHMHALFSYGPVNEIKERVVKNFDHLEIYKEAEKKSKLKMVKIK